MKALQKYIRKLFCKFFKIISSKNLRNESFLEAFCESFKSLKIYGFAC